MGGVSVVSRQGARAEWRVKRKRSKAKNEEEDSCVEVITKEAQKDVTKSAISSRFKR